MASQSRKVFHSVSRKGTWTVTLSNRAVAIHATQAESGKDAKERARHAHEAGSLARAVLHSVDESIRTEHMDGKDPERYPG